MHRVRAKVNTAGPFHAAKVGIDDDGVENPRIQQFRNTPPRRSGSTGKIPLTPSLKVTFNRQSGSGLAETIRIMFLFYSNG